MKPVVLIVIVAVAPMGALIPLVEAQPVFIEMSPEYHHIPELVDGNSTGSAPYMAGWHDSGGSTPSVNKTKITVSFPDTDPSVIQEDNWLVGGMFVTGMDNAKKQIDYAYWTMVTLHSDGSLYFDVGVYQTYEALPPWPNNTNPWKILLYASSYWISGASPSDHFTLTTRFDQPSGMVHWSCEVSQTTFTLSFNITESIYARTIQRAFKVGVYDMPLELRLVAPWAYPYWLVYYFQFGIMSKYNIGHGGWNVKLEYPQYYKDNGWHGFPKAKSIGGANAFLDARWVWGGENYEGVNAYYEKNSPLLWGTIIFYYSGSTLADHTLLWAISGGGGGCPFVYVWNGSEYVIDNNILGDSEASGGTDVDDYYRLEQPLVPKEGKYSLLIREFEQEHSYLDQVQLLAVDHKSDVQVAATHEGEILTYKNPNQPISAVDNYGNSQLDLVATIDNNYYEAYPSDFIVLDFGNLDINNSAKLVFRANYQFKKPEFECVHIQVLDIEKSWVDIAVLRTRETWSTQIVDLSSYLPDANGELKVRLYSTALHRIDYVGLDTSKQDEIDVHYANLVSAVHSEEDSVKTKLSESDGVYAELVPSQQIELAFTLPQNSKDARTYIIHVKGHYYTIS